MAGPISLPLPLGTENLEMDVAGFKDRQGSRATSCWWCHEGDRLHSLKGTPGDRGEASPGGAPHLLTTSLPPRQGRSWPLGLALVTELMAGPDAVPETVPGHFLRSWRGGVPGLPPGSVKGRGGCASLADLGPASGQNGELGNEIFLLLLNCRPTSIFISWHVKKKKEMTRQPWIHGIHPKSK